MELEPFFIKNLTFDEDDSTLITNIILGGGARFFGSDPRQISHSQYRHSAREETGQQLKKEGNAYGY